MPNYLEKQHGDVHNYANQLEISAFGHQIIDLVKSVCSDGTNTPYVMSIHNSSQILKSCFHNQQDSIGTKMLQKYKTERGK